MSLQYPKPGKRRRAPFTKYPDGRVRCNTEAAWEKHRKIVFEREQGLCEKCMAFAPLHNTDRAFAGHAHHVNGRKCGDDSPGVLMWICGRCHSKLHIPIKVIPPKPKAREVFLIQPHQYTDRHLEEMLEGE